MSCVVNEIIFCRKLQKLEVVCCISQGTEKIKDDLMAEAVEYQPEELDCIPDSATEFLCDVGQVTSMKLFTGGHYLYVPHVLDSELEMPGI